MSSNGIMVIETSVKIVQMVQTLRWRNREHAYLVSILILLLIKFNDAASVISFAYESNSSQFQFSFLFVKRSNVKHHNNNFHRSITTPRTILYFLHAKTVTS